VSSRFLSCGFEGQPGGLTVAHARNCDLTGLSRDRLAGPVSITQAEQQAENRRIRTMITAIRRGEAGRYDVDEVAALVAAGLVTMGEAMNSDF